MASCYQHHIVLEINLQSPHVIFGPSTATSRRACTGTEAYRNPNEVSLGPLFSIYSTASCGLHVSCCHCVMHFHKISSETVGRPDQGLLRCTLYLRISFLISADLAEYMRQVFKDDFGGKNAKL